MTPELDADTEIIELEKKAQEFYTLCDRVVHLVENSNQLNKQVIAVSC